MYLSIFFEANQIIFIFTCGWKRKDHLVSLPAPVAIPPLGHRGGLFAHFVRPNKLNFHMNYCAGHVAYGDGQEPCPCRVH